ncbi:serine hydrolase domain-containing protein [Agromyces sp. MMS24-K17]|uniref:serine hydrolase domain-containing protein n=1 Tax=Agromyces sp. MMS24-K17 TaxID=3372850 RepID=UPI0037542DE4
MPHTLPRSTPAGTGLDPAAIDRLLAGLDRLQEPHAVMVVHRGQVVAEAAWHPYRLADPQLLFSVSKTFTSVAVGLAVDEGLLSIDDRVIDLLPDDAPAEPSANLAATRVRHLLTMTSGHASESMEAIGRTGGTWAQDLLAAPVEHVPGTRFVYDTGSSYLLSAILHRLTGGRVLDFLRPRVLEPLGVVDAHWELDPQGIDVGGYGLSIPIEGMAALGELFRLGGRLGDRQLVPAAWIEAASAAQVPNGPNVSPDWAAGYGYQVWRCRNGAYRADGAFGQFIVVWPERELVVAIFAGIQDMQEELSAVWEAFGDGSAADGTPGGDAGTVADGAAPASLALPTVVGAAADDVEALVLGRTFAFAAPDEPAEPAAPADAVDAADADASSNLDDEALRLASVRVDRDERGRIVLGITRADGGTEVVAGHGEWVVGDAGLDAPVGARAAASAAWTGPRTLVVRVLSLSTPFAWTWTATFAPDGTAVDLVVDQNVAFGPTRLFDGTLRAD